MGNAFVDLTKCYLDTNKEIIKAYLNDVRSNVLHEMLSKDDRYIITALRVNALYNDKHLSKNSVHHPTLI